MVKRLIGMAAVAVASWAAHAPVWAAASSSATLGDLTIELVDLNPGDGISPSISFAGVATGASRAFNSDPFQHPDDEVFAAGPFVAFSVSTSTLHSASGASVTGGAPATLTGASTLIGTIMAGGYANGTSAFLGLDESGYSASGGVNYHLSTQFTVSANTLVLFSAAGTVAASVTTSYVDSPYNYEYATAFADIRVEGPGASGGGLQSSFDELGLFFDNLSGPNADTSSRSLAASFTNLTGSSMDGKFHAAVSANGVSYAAAVPEPSAYWLAAAGVAVLGMAARRRKPG